ncbi:MAG: GrpB family protein [Devosia sp.]|nr:GrpB family protein [Devosia sp.]
MAPSVAVELKPHDRLWAGAVAAEAERLAAALGPELLAVHHIGSTAIPGIVAKPVLDIVPVVRSLDALDDARAEVEALGYQWWGEYGLAGRRFCTLDDPATGKRRIHLHCYQQGATAIGRHLAFRDYLVARPELARQYEAVKRRCFGQHPTSSHDYSTCKGDWIRRIEAEALKALG